ncbi:Gfo/Idh/MocA family protein [Flavilitoribacter nigricans]|uniref:Glucose-fructose oxidoreductase n=1 Tax=Flavilitoribacter nigricans (strain ATCC 23147 / DSM 23189 / NBRC 102662 / NCIMB 1420 / SS-2) TaxID=1122177 RepID=A0A2D0NIE7_FLAN2|nr:Gfo/Idh/MocA family oxidoreductase [Flavilitoribacter nigricans]PHN08272.1 glucose-fructose oxidoreductase [Flavilitoribacter nigricans DSM 23189 = NBRC 102662]
MVFYPASLHGFLRHSGDLAASTAGLYATAETTRNFSNTIPDPKLTGRPVPKLLVPMPKPPEERIGFAIVGLGAYALNQIIPNLANTQGAKLTALVSGNTEKAREVGKAYGISSDHIYDYDNFDRIALDDTVDVVYIILPNTLHRSMTERAFAAGKHVLCEKPMAITVEDCEAMIQAGKAAGKKLMIGYRAQYDPYNLKAIELVRGKDGKPGQIGDVRLFTSDHGRLLNLDHTRDQWRAKKELAGGGALYDIGIYALNGARYMFDEEPTEVMARFREGSGRSEVTVEEGVEWSMAFPSKAVATCTTSYLVAQGKLMHIYGAEGTVSLNPATDYFERNLTFQPAEGPQQHFSFPLANQFAAMLDEMASAVREDREPKTPGEEGLKDVRIMEAIYESARKQKPVSL